MKMPAEGKQIKTKQNKHKFCAFPKILKPDGKKIVWLNNDDYYIRRMHVKPLRLFYPVEKNKTKYHTRNEYRNVNEHLGLIRFEDISDRRSRVPQKQRNVHIKKYEHLP